MDPAHAQEHHRAIETLAPSRRRVGPLVGAAKICQLVAHAHQLAVDASGVGGTDAAGDDRQHRLVEHCETVSDIALLDQRDALADQRVRTQRLVLVASTDRGNRPGRLDGAVEVAGGERLVDRQRLQIAVLHALRLALEQPLRLADPPRTHRLLAPQIPRDADVDRQHCSLPRSPVVAVKEQAIGLLAGREALVDRALPPRRVSQRRHVAG